MSKDIVLEEREGHWCRECEGVVNIVSGDEIGFVCGCRDLVRERADIPSKWVSCVVHVKKETPEKRPFVTITPDEYFASQIQTPSNPSSLNCRSGKRTDEVRSKSVQLPTEDGKLSFRCSCGEKHQFLSTENKEGVLLEVMLSRSNNF